MSSVSRTLSAPSAIGFAFLGFGQATNGSHFSEEFSHRPCRRTRPALALRDIMHQPRRSSDLSERSDRNVIGNTDPSTQHHEVAERDGTGKPAMAGDYATTADPNIVGDL